MRIAAWAQGERHEASVPHHEAGTTRLADGREIGWASYGDPTGDLVMWFHGTPGARAQVPADVADEAIARRLRVVSVERPGTGHSTPHVYADVASAAPDYLAVADDLGAQQFAMVGLSGGGPFVLSVAYAAPERATSAVVIGGVGPTRGADAIISYTLGLIPLASVLERIRDPLGSGLGAAIRTLGPWGRPFLDLFFMAQYGDRQAMNDHPAHKSQMLFDLVDAAHRAGVRAPVDDLILFGRPWGFELHRVRTPVTFWGSSDDWIVPYRHAERQSKRVPNGRLRTVVHRGHFAGYTEVDEVFDAIREDWPLLRAVETPAKRQPAKRQAATTQRAGSQRTGARRARPAG